MLPSRSNAMTTSMALPDFRSLGVILRILLLSEGLRLIFVCIGHDDFKEIIQAVVQSSGVFEPALLSLLIVLYIHARRFSSLPYALGNLLVILLATLSGIAWGALFVAMFPGETGLSLLRTAMMAMAISSSILFYFDWRYRVLSPALPEARLLALQARIRPHFLFNSLNTVLGLIRTEPKRAETVLEGLAELFRALMAEANTLTPLARELDLARSYMEVETIRLGERLSVDWQCQNAPPDALVPPLILQPLLENAVYHGIEPAEGGGTITVAIFVKGDQLNLVVRNPVRQESERKAGNRMALNNIRERLDLHFDAEATLRAYQAGEEFVVQIRMPYRHG